MTIEALGSACSCISSLQARVCSALSTLRGKNCCFSLVCINSLGLEGDPNFVSVMQECLVICSLDIIDYDAVSKSTLSSGSESSPLTCLASSPPQGYETVSEGSLPSSKIVLLPIPLGLYMRVFTPKFIFTESAELIFPCSPVSDEITECFFKQSFKKILLEPSWSFLLPLFKSISAPFEGRFSFLKKTKS